TSLRIFTGLVWVAGRAAPVEGLPGDVGEIKSAVRDQGELVAGQDAHDVAAPVLGLLAARVGDDQCVTARVGPEDVLPAGGGAELVPVGQGLAGAGRVLGDLDVAAKAGRGDNLGAVRREEGVAAVQKGAGEGQDDLGRGERGAGGGGIQHPHVHGVVAAPLLESQVAAVGGPGEDLADRLDVANSAARPGPGPGGAGGQRDDLDGLAEVQGEPGAVGGDPHPA